MPSQRSTFVSIQRPPPSQLRKYTTKKTDTNTEIKFAKLCISIPPTTTTLGKISVKMPFLMGVNQMQKSYCWCIEKMEEYYIWRIKVLIVPFSKHVFTFQNRHPMVHVKDYIEKVEVWNIKVSFWYCSLFEIKNNELLTCLSFLRNFEIPITKWWVNYSKVSNLMVNLQIIHDPIDSKNPWI